jgi:hypothetical protein
MYNWNLSDVPEEFKTEKICLTAISFEICTQKIHVKRIM